MTRLTANRRRRKDKRVRSSSARQSRAFMLELLEERLPPAVVLWDGGGDGSSWSDPSNWDSDSLPGPSDDVVIDVVENPTVRLETANVSVRSVSSEEAITIDSGSLTVSHESVVNGAFAMGENSSLTASGADASFTVNASSSLDGPNLLASGGGRLIFTATTAYTANESNRDTTILATGAGSLIDLSPIDGDFEGNSRVGDGHHLVVEAVDGGHIDLSNALGIRYKVTLTATGADSLLNMASAQEMNGAGFGSKGHTSLTVNGDGQVAADGLATIVCASLLANDGGTLSLPSIASYSGPQSGTEGGQYAIQATGPGSVVVLSNLTDELVGNSTPSGTSASVRIEAIDGGHVDLSNVGTVRHMTRIAATGMGSEVDLSSLVTLDGMEHGYTDTTQLTISDNGVVLVDNLATVRCASLFANDGLTLSLPSITSYAGPQNKGGQYAIRATGPGSVVDMSNLTDELVGNSTPSGTSASVRIEAIDGGCIDLSNVGTIRHMTRIAATGMGSEVDLSSLVTLDGMEHGYSDTTQITISDNGVVSVDNLATVRCASLFANDGLTLSLPSITSYAGPENRGGGYSVRATGPGSIVDLSNLTDELVGNSTPSGTSASVRIEAIDGGHVDLSNVGTIRHMTRIAATGMGSEVDLSSLLTLDGMEHGYTDTTQITISDHGVVSVDNLATVRCASLFANDGLTLSLPSITSYAGPENRAGGYSIRATGPGSVVDMSNLTNELVGNSTPSGTSASVHIEAIDGGRIDLSNVGTVRHMTIIAATGMGSEVDLSSLVTLDGMDHGYTHTTQIRIDDYGAVRLDSLATVNAASLFANDGLTLSLPAITSYSGPQNGYGVYCIRATGPGSVVDLSNLAGELSGSSATENDVAVLLEAIGGGRIDLSNVETIRHKTRIASTNTGSEIDLSSMVTLDGMDHGYSDATQITISDHGVVLLDSLATVRSASLFANDGLTLSLPSIISYAGPESGEGHYAIRASGPSSVVDLSNLTTELAGGHNETVQIEALAGGHVDLSNAQAIRHRTGIFSTGIDSEIDLSSLVVLDGMDWGGIDATRVEISDSGVVRLDSLATVESASLIANDGLVLSLPSISSYVGPETGGGDYAIRATGAGSVVDLSNLTDELVGGFNAIVVVKAIDGGHINLCNVEAVRRKTTIISTGTGSEIDFSSLVVLDGMNGGGTDSTRVEIRDRGVISLDNLATVRSASVIANDGLSLSLPSITSYVGPETGGGKYAIRAVGPGSVVDLSNLTGELVGGHNGVVTIEAVEGGSVDLSNVEAVRHRTRVFSTGAGSAIDLSSMVIMDGMDYADSDMTRIAISDGGVVFLDSLATVKAVSLTANDGLTLSLPSITSYSGPQSGKGMYFIRAVGAGSVVDLSNLTGELLGSSVTGTGAAVLIEAVDGGQLDLSNLEAIRHKTRITSTGTGSAIDLSSLVTLDGMDHAYTDTTRITVSDNGGVLLDSLATVRSASLIANGGSNVVAALDDNIRRSRARDWEICDSGKRRRQRG